MHLSPMNIAKHVSQIISNSAPHPNPPIELWNWNVVQCMYLEAVLLEKRILSIDINPASPCARVHRSEGLARAHRVYIYVQNRCIKTACRNSKRWIPHPCMSQPLYQVIDVTPCVHKENRTQQSCGANIYTEKQKICRVYPSRGLCATAYYERRT